MHTTELRSRLATALEPERELRRIIENRAGAGESRSVLYSDLEQLLFSIRNNPDARLSEDMVLDVMDALEGWCHPTAAI